MQETWKDIIELNNYYQISNYGRVKRTTETVMFKYMYQLKEGEKFFTYIVL